MGIQSFFIDKKIKKIKLLEQSKVSEDKELGKINKVALLVDEKTQFKYSDFKKLQQLLKLDDVHFNILTLKDKSSNYNEFKGYVLKTNDIKWYGGLRSHEFDEFVSKEYDLLIDYIYEDQPISNMIIAQIHAVLKVGYGDKNTDFYNIVLHVTPDQILAFNEELVKYLKILKLV